MALPTAYDLGALRGGVVQMTLDLGHGRLLDERPDGDIGIEAVADLQPVDGLDEPLEEGIVDARLHEDPVGADACLAGVAELGVDGALDSGVQVSIVEHDERRVPAQLEGEPFDRPGALRHEQFSDFGRPCEGEHPHGLVAGEDGSDSHGVTVDDVEQARRQPGTRPELSQSEPGQRCLAGRFQHYGAAGGQGRGHLAGDHKGREVPWRNGRDHADGLAQAEKPPATSVRGDHLAVPSAGLFGVEPDEGGAVGDLTARLG